MIRPLTPGDAAALVALRREALDAAPLAFGASPADDRLLAPSYPMASLGSSPDAAIFGAFADDALAGMAGVLRLDKLKARHRVLLWGMYVRPAARGRGLGAALLAAAVTWAREQHDVTQLELSVTEAAPAAGRLYARAGFVRWGTQPDALAVAGRRVAEHHLVLQLDA